MEDDDFEVKNRSMDTWISDAEYEQENVDEESKGESSDAEVLPALLTIHQDISSCSLPPPSPEGEPEAGEGEDETRIQLSEAGEEEQESRKVYLGNHPKAKTNIPGNNKVFTKRFTLLNFLPKFLWEQFKAPAEIFFVIAALVQSCSGSTFQAEFTPLFILHGVQALLQIYEDYDRYRNDQKKNRSETIRLKGSGERKITRWGSLKVGDLVLLESETNVPADIVMLGVACLDADPDGVAELKLRQLQGRATCYIQTAGLDGESNLKERVAVLTQREIEALISTEGPSLSGFIECDQPNPLIHHFNGRITVQHESSRITMPLGPDNLLLRESKIARIARVDVNVIGVIGCVVYAGNDTKIVQNYAPSHFKSSTTRQFVHQQLSLMFLLLFVLIVVSTGLSWRFDSRIDTNISQLMNESSDEKVKRVLDLLSAYKIKIPNSLVKAVFYIVRQMLEFLSIYNFIVPISLFTTLGILRIILANLISFDMGMYDEENDIRAQVNSLELVDELGRIRLVLTDKTGTLTCNKMDLNRLSCNGSKYDVDFEDIESIQKITDYRGLDGQVLLMLLTVACCNTIIVSDGEYHGSSSDEIALVVGASKVGLHLKDRRHVGNEQHIILEIGKEELHLVVLRTQEFTSATKYSALVVRIPLLDNRVFILGKGADTVLLPLLDRDEDREEMQGTLKEFMKSGLRTLCYFTHEVFPSVQSHVLNPKTKILKCGPFRALGVTGIDDALQEGVPATIEHLYEAGVKVWVATGDQVETAIQVALTAHIVPLRCRTTLLVGNEIASQIDKVLAEEADFIANLLKETKPLESVIVVDGGNLTCILENPERIRKFFGMAKWSRTVIMCRASPEQKARVAELIRPTLGLPVLAIGDGGNDMGMVRTATVGVGISVGPEAGTAARVADFSIPHFRDLRRLLILHGMASYNRIAMMVIFMLYKNVALAFVQVAYVMTGLSGFSTTPILPVWLVTLNNTVFAVIPPIFLGFTEWYVSGEWLLGRRRCSAQLFRMVGERGGSRLAAFDWWVRGILWGMAHGAMVFFPICFLNSTSSAMADGQTIANHNAIGVIMISCLLSQCQLKTAILANNVTVVLVAVIVVIYLAWFLYLTMGSNPYFTGMSFLCKSPSFYTLFLLIPVASLYFDVAMKYLRRQYRPEEYHIIQALEKQEERRTRAKESGDRWLWLQNMNPWASVQPSDAEEPDAAEETDKTL